MAVFLKDDRFTCDCGYVEFEVIELKAFQSKENKLGDRTNLLIEDHNRRILKCAHCGKKYDIQKDLDADLMLKE